MSQNVCNICGANYEYRNGRWVCPACGAYKQEELSNEEVTLLYNAAQKLRVQEFDDAEEQYLDIIQKFPKQHEAYWGCVCARYGIKVEEDYDGRKIPTCCFPSIESFLEDKDFKKAVELAPAEMATWYKEQAAYIEKVRTTWIDMAKNETPYDIFISYKDSDEAKDIERTKDSINALELYNHLARQGYNVFYSRESLRDKIGEKYEPYIFNALKTAKIMILYGTSVEYINSTWVKNEWHRFLKQIARGEKKDNSLLVVCDGFSPTELPKVLSSKQCLDGTSKTLYVDIDNYLKQLFSLRDKEEAIPQKKQIKVSPLHEHIYIDEVIPSTCISRGYTLHKCRCGYEYKDNYTKLAEHTYQYKSTKEPTCTDEGYKEYVCSVCGDIKKEPIPAKGHNFGDWVEQIHPTCVQKGKSVRQCKECGFLETMVTPALDHEWGKPEYRSKGDGTGAYYIVCQRCGEEKKAANCLKNGVYHHKWTFYKHDCQTESGTDYIYRCEVCGEKKRVGLPIINVGDTLQFGQYYSTPMNWTVLAIKDNKALILSKYSIDKHFGDEGSYYTKRDLCWSTSEMRQWLNAEFLNSTFSNDEKNRICETFNVNSCQESIDSTDKYGEETKIIKYVKQDSTKDKVFLLSVDEIKKYVSEKDMNCSIISKDGIKSSYRDKWKSRTIGAHRYKDNKVSVWGFVVNDEGSTYQPSTRPAMWVDISSSDDLWKRIQEEKKAEAERLKAEQQRIQREQKEIEQRQAEAQRQALEAKLKSSKTNAWGSFAATVGFAIWAIIDWTNGGTIGWGVISSIIAVCCGIASAGFFKDYSTAKEEIEKQDKK